MNLITIAYYSQVHRAYFDKNTLEENGIDAYKTDKLTIQSDWYIANAVGNIKLQVEEEDVLKAQEILNTVRIPLEVEHTIDNPKYSFKCPQCKSNHIYRSDQISFFFTLTMLIGIPLPVRSSTFCCYYCNHRWEGPF